MNIPVIGSPAGFLIVISKTLAKTQKNEERTSTVVSPKSVLPSLDVTVKTMSLAPVL
ncbi:hypothetical protein [Peribacillus alkalitolerans]|uniref:hypothetical protein n=1 Tax=Peribacillus alkalitolerans TaxID=1550385 RepID=UPI0013D01F0A|nr:hypothetical protein [Peribacillus alkalitolerans]